MADLASKKGEKIVVFLWVIPRVSYELELWTIKDRFMRFRPGSVSSWDWNSKRLRDLTFIALGKQYQIPYWNCLGSKKMGWQGRFKIGCRVWWVFVWLPRTSADNRLQKPIDGDLLITSQMHLLAHLDQPNAILRTLVETIVVSYWDADFIQESSTFTRTIS